MKLLENLWHGFASSINSSMCWRGSKQLFHSLSWRYTQLHTQSTTLWQEQEKITHHFAKSKQLLGAKLQCITRKHSRSLKYCMKGLENCQLGRQKQTPECMFVCYYVIDSSFWEQSQKQGGWKEGSSTRSFAPHFPLESGSNKIKDLSLGPHFWSSYEPRLIFHLF